MTPRQIEQALVGSREQLSALVAALAPEIQSEVGHVLRRATARQHRDPREEMRDLVQEVLLKLLVEDKEILRKWDPTRGSLRRYVRVVTQRYVIGKLRSKRRNPYTDEPVDTLDELTGLSPELGRRVSARERLDLLLVQLQDQLDERSWRLFTMLFVEELDVEEVMATTDMTRDAIYAWRYRFKKRLDRLLDELDEE